MNASKLNIWKWREDNNRFGTKKVHEFTFLHCRRKYSARTRRTNDIPNSRRNSYFETFSIFFLVLFKRVSRGLEHFIIIFFHFRIFPVAFENFRYLPARPDFPVNFSEHAKIYFKINFISQNKNRWHFLENSRQNPFFETFSTFFNTF